MTGAALWRRRSRWSRWSRWRLPCGSSSCSPRSMWMPRGASRSARSPIRSWPRSGATCARSTTFARTSRERSPSTTVTTTVLGTAVPDLSASQRPESTTGRNQAVLGARRTDPAAPAHPKRDQRPQHPEPATGRNQAVLGARRTDPAAPAHPKRDQRPQHPEPATGGSRAILCARRTDPAAPEHPKRDQRPQHPEPATGGSQAILGARRTDPAAPAHPKPATDGLRTQNPRPGGAKPFCVRDGRTLPHPSTQNPRPGGTTPFGVRDGRTGPHPRTQNGGSGAESAGQIRPSSRTALRSSSSSAVEASILPRL